MVTTLSNENEALDALTSIVLPLFENERPKLDRLDRWWRWNPEPIRISARKMTPEHRDMRNIGETPWLGLVVTLLSQMRLPKVSKTLGDVKISVTQINAGTQHNVVPDKCNFVVDVRTTDAYSNEETLELLRRAVEPLGAILTPRSTRLKPSGISENHPVVSRLKMLGKEPFGSSTLSDQALMPWQSLKLGPGDSARSHTADEFLYMREIREAICVYIRVLDNL